MYQCAYSNIYITYEPIAILSNSQPLTTRLLSVSLMEEQENQKGLKIILGAYLEKVAIVGQLSPSTDRRYTPEL